MNAFTTLDQAHARDAAEKAGKLIDDGDPRPLLGIPVGIKDLVDTRGIRTTYGSSIYQHNVPDRDADIVAKLRAAGAIILGKTATHEFAWGFSTDNPHFGPTRNPWDPKRIAGGSSGGSAAALAARLCPLAIGTDTGGSIRLPAAYCGICGLKPSYGSFDLSGILPLAPSFDHLGPLARTPADLLLFLAAIAGVPPGPNQFHPSLAGLKVGYLLPRPDQQAPTDIAAVLGSFLSVLENSGAEIRPIEPDILSDAATAFVRLMTKEAVETHQALGHLPDGLDFLGEDLRARVTLSTSFTTAQLTEALEQRRRLRAAFEGFFESVDLIVSLCSSTAPMELSSGNITPSLHYAPLRETVLEHTACQNLTGHPACVLRAGFDRYGLPVGIQITAPMRKERLALNLASVYFSRTPAIQNRWPDIEPTLPSSRKLSQ